MKSFCRSVLLQMGLVALGAPRATICFFIFSLYGCHDPYLSWSCAAIFLNAELADGIYDPSPDVYYFSDATQVRVFSLSTKQWLSAIPIPSPAQAYGPQRLWGLSLSPDDSKLAIADPGAGAMWLAPAAVKSVSFIKNSAASIVPMNHSNKDRASSEKSEEGRLRLKGEHSLI